MAFKIKLLLLLMLLIAIPIASAAYQLGTPLDLTVGCDKINCTLGWNITVLNPNSTILVNNAVMDVGDYYSNYSFTPATQGTYLIYLTDTDGAESYSTSAEVNYSGLELNEGKAILYIGFFGILVLMFIATFFGIGMLPASNERDEEGKLLSISYLKYFRNVLWLVEWMLLIGIVYIASNLSFAYLGEQLMAKTFFMIFHIMFAITPVIVIVWVIWIFVSMFHDKHLQNLLNRGMFGNTI